MNEANCRTAAELDEETTRLYEILLRATPHNTREFEEAAGKACDSTLTRVMERIAGGQLAERWTGTIQAILKRRNYERASARTRDRRPLDNAL